MFFRYATINLYFKIQLPESLRIRLDLITGKNNIEVRSTVQESIKKPNYCIITFSKNWINEWNDIWNESYIEMWIWNQVNLWSSQFWVMKPEKNGFEAMTSRWGCDTLTNWAMKPLMLGDDHLWVPVFLWWMNQQNDIWNESNNIIELQIWNHVKLHIWS